MDREIKFRAFDKRNKQMEYRNILREITCFFPYQDINERIAYANNNDYILMQYVGLKDKNGKEIYEGDIYNYEGEIGVFKSIEDFYYSELIEYRVKDGEVIGNIYENPELLKGAT